MMKKTLLTFFIILSIVGICFLWKKNFSEEPNEKKVEIEMEMTENDMAMVIQLGKSKIFIGQLFQFFCCFFQ